MSKQASSIHRFIDGYRGSLLRKSQLNGAWKNRYFILEQKKIRCYEDDSCLKLVSELIVFNDIELFDLPGTSDNRANLFYFSASVDDVYYLSADHNHDKTYWLEAISDAKHNGFKLMDQPRLGIEPFYPSIDLCVTFGDHSIFASNDNKLHPQSIESAPSVIMRFARPNSIYSLIMIDLDSVRTNAEARTEYLMWGIVNIEGTDVSSGLELAPYESPAPEYGSGMHRYVLLLFDQSSDFTPDQFDLLDEMFLRRETFNHLDWMKQFHLAAPVGINGFYAGWEEHCDVLHERMGYVPAVVYFSPKMEGEAETVRTEKARVDLFRDLVLNDIFPPDEIDANSAPSQGTIAMTIEYDNDYVVEDGQTIPASQVKSEPAVAFYPHPIAHDVRGQPDCGLYTLLLVDPDAPSRINHDLREFIYWVVLNIADADVPKGDVALPYMGPAPSYASGLHRNVFCLYKQKKTFSPGEVEDTKKFFASRKGITSFDWVRGQHDSLYKVPVGVEAFLSEWDLSVDDAHAAMAYMPPEQYRSPAQRRSMLIAGAGTPRPGFSAMTPRTADQDVIGSRLRKIHEAEERFNIKVTETSRVNHDLAHSNANSNVNSGANTPKGDHEEMFGVNFDDEQVEEAKPAPRKVAPRNPVTFSGTSKTLSPRDSTNQPLSLSLSEDNSVAASTAALRDSSNEQKNDVITSSRETTTASATSVAKRAEHHTDQSQKANTVNKARRETSDGHFSEEVTESQQDQHFEERTERSERSEHSEMRQESHSATSSPRKSIKAGTQQTIEDRSELSQSRDVHETSSRNQQAQLKQLQAEAQQKQEEEAQQQELARREQKNALKRQQQDLLERQAQEQQRQQKQLQEQQDRDFQEQQQRSTSSRRQREQEDAERQDREAYELQQQQRSGGSSRRQREEQERADREAWEREQQQQQRAGTSSRRQREQQEQLDRQTQEQQVRQSSSRQQVEQVQRQPSPRGSKQTQEEHKDPSSPPKGRTKDFFSALPDSEYSDTDTGSVISGVPQSDRYQQEKQQTQQSQQGQKTFGVASSSNQRSQGHAMVDLEDQSVASDTSSQQPSVARSSVDLRQQAAAKRTESGSGSSGARYKQLLEGLATVKSTSQLCDLFQVSTSSIFAGEKMKKKMNNDFMFKDSYIWVIPRTRTLHWSKTKGDAGDSKYLLLDTVTGVDPTAPPKGEFKGIVKRVRVSGPNLLITIESGDFLELKLSADGAPPAQKRANDWAVVIKAFTQG